MLWGARGGGREGTDEEEEETRRKAGFLLKRVSAGNRTVQPAINPASWPSTHRYVPSHRWKPSCPLYKRERPDPLCPSGAWNSTPALPAAPGLPDRIATDRRGCSAPLSMLTAHPDNHLTSNSAVEPVVARFLLSAASCRASRNNPAKIEIIIFKYAFLFLYFLTRILEIFRHA